METDTLSQPRIRVAALITSDQGILLVRHEKDGHSYWLLPGGGVNYGEALGEAIVRELWEEARLRVEPGQLVMVNDTIAANWSRHAVQIVLEARIIEGEPRVGEDARVVEVRYMPVDQLVNIELRPTVAEHLLEFLNTGIRPGYVGRVWRD